MNKSEIAGRYTHLPAFLFCNEKMYVWPKKQMCVVTFVDFGTKQKAYE